jgi:hypothetical protein
MMEEKVREAIIAELQRQAEANGARLRIAVKDELLTVNGDIDLDALAMAVVGAVSGGP